jgi:hypothetical protein
MSGDDDGIDLLDGAEGEEDADAESVDERDPEGPLGDLAARVNREDRDALDAEEAFEEIDAGEVNVEDVWEELEAGRERTGETVGEAGGEDVRRIEKSVCHQCPNFGDPPELHCTNEGTTIREMPDNERFVVVDCPVVGGDSE